MACAACEAPIGSVWTLCRRVARTATWLRKVLEVHELGDHHPITVFKGTMSVIKHGCKQIGMSTHTHTHGPMYAPLVLRERFL